MLSQKRSCPERRMSVNLKCKSGHVLSLDDLHVLTCALECTELVLQGKRGGQCPVLVPREAPLLQLKLKVPPILRLHFFFMLTTSQQYTDFSSQLGRLLHHSEKESFRR